MPRCCSPADRASGRRIAQTLATGCRSPARKPIHWRPGRRTSSGSQLHIRSFAAARARSVTCLNTRSVAKARRSSLRLHPRYAPDRAGPPRCSTCASCSGRYRCALVYRSAAPHPGMPRLRSATHRRQRRFQLVYVAIIGGGRSERSASSRAAGPLPSREGPCTTFARSVARCRAARPTVAAASLAAVSVPGRRAGQDTRSKAVAPTMMTAPEATASAPSRGRRRRGARTACRAAPPRRDRPGTIGPFV